MKTATTLSVLPFLAGGGEMGALTRAKDWGVTPLGPPEGWPQSLRTTLSIILNSRFPMFLWWGTDLICFYNDAYRPSLGSNGKHPHILGMKAEEAWPEIWETIKPLIDDVLLGGGATWSEDQLIPIFRNGAIEDVYWTFSYSPVTDESGTPAGVLVTCQETTEKVRIFNEVKQNEEQLNFTIDAADLGTWDLNPATNKFVGNDRLKEWFGLGVDEEIALPLAMEAMVPADRDRVANEIKKAIAPGSSGEYNVAYRIRARKTGKERTVVAKGRAFFNADGAATRFSGILQDITERAQAREKLDKEAQKFRSTVQQAPVGITIFRGREFVVEMANDTYLQLVDRKREQFIGKPLFEVLPEVKASVEDLLINVYTTGIPYYGTDFPVTLRRGGKDEQTYFSFVYQPYREDDGTVTGVIVVATEVTASVRAKQTLAESEKQFRGLIMSSPIPIAVFRGSDFVIETANRVMCERIWRKKPEEVIGKKALEVFPEIKEQKYEALLRRVLATGEVHREIESLAFVQGDDGMKKFYLDYEYAPVFDQDGTASGIRITVNDVTEKVAARQKLEESEKRFRNVANSVPVLMWISDTDKCATFFNKAWLSFTGRRLEEEIGQGWSGGVHPGDIGRYMSIYNAAFDKQEEFHTEYRLRRHDGEYRWVADTGVPFFSPDGLFEGYIGACSDIHEITIYQKKLKDTEERMRLANEASGVATFDLDLQTREILYSTRLPEIFGHDPSTLMSHDQLLSQLHSDDRQVVRSAFEAALLTGSYYYDARIVTPAGDIRWIKTEGKIFYVEGEQPLKLIGTIEDVTEEKNHQQELADSERKFRLLADSLPQFIWTGDAAGNLNYFSQSVYDYSGLTAEQINKDGWLQIVHPDDRDENISKWTEAVSTGKNFHFEHRFRRHDGLYRWQLSRATPQRDAAGNILMWVGTSTDIEEQKRFARDLQQQISERTKELQRSAEELIKSEERYHLMVGEVQDYAIIFLNKEGVVENWNKGAQKIKGYTADEILGKSFAQFYTEKDRTAGLPEKLLNEALVNGKASNEGWRVKKDGSRFWANVVITALHNEQGEVIGFSKVTRDLTERRVAEEKVKLHTQQLEQKSSELEKMNAELQSFAYVSSHDLQEPLRKIQTFSSRIMEKENDRLSDKGKDYFHRMQLAAGRMQTLIEDLLTYSRTNSSDLVFTKTDIGELVDEVRKDMKEALAEKHARIEVAPSCSADIIPFQFRQIMQNLVGNALKFGKEGVPPVIRVTCRSAKGEDLDLAGLIPEITYTHVKIEDNGIGFDPQYSERIFEIFQRLHGKDEYKGTGIGLAIVKKIVQNHGGMIRASGILDKGATFDIYLPSK